MHVITSSSLVGRDGVRPRDLDMSQLICDRGLNDLSEGY